MEKFLHEAYISIVDEYGSTIPTDSEFIEFSNEIRNKFKNELTFDIFQECKQMASMKFKKYFNSKLFLKLEIEYKGGLTLDALFTSLLKAIDIESMYLTLINFCSLLSKSKLDDDITEEELSLFLISILPDIACNSKIPNDFMYYYGKGCARRMFFFLDSRNSGKVSFSKLVFSSLFEELIHLKRLGSCILPLDTDIFHEQMNANSFYYKNLIRLYQLFRSLDKDNSGNLCAEELLEFQGIGVDNVQLTYVACKEIIRKYKCKETSELDFLGFLNLVFVFECPNSLASLSYFWKLLDIDNVGLLSKRNISYFYKDITNEMNKYNNQVPSNSVFLTEVYDLLHFNKCDGITFEEFRNSGNGVLVALILLDILQFIRYEQRESYLPQTITDN